MLKPTLGLRRRRSGVSCPPVRVPLLKKNTKTKLKTQNGNAGVLARERKRWRLRGLTDQSEFTIGGADIGERGVFANSEDGVVREGRSTVGSSSFPIHSPGSTNTRITFTTEKVTELTDPLEKNLKKKKLVWCMYSYLDHRERGERERKESKGGEFLRERERERWF